MIFDPVLQWERVVKEGGKEMALPLEKKRKLPTWMIQLAKTSPAKPAGRTVLPVSSCAGNINIINIKQCCIPCLYLFPAAVTGQEQLSYVVRDTDRDQQLTFMSGSCFHTTHVLHMFFTSTCISGTV